MSSTELFDAASISITSSEGALAIARHDSHCPHGDTVGPFTQFSDAARILAIDVFPVPREPTNRYAWWTLPCSIALRRVRTTWSWPTTSAKVRGRWRRYSEAKAVGTGQMSLVRVPTAPERSPEFAQGAVDAALDGGQGLPEDLGDLGHGEVGAEAQGDRLALLGSERGQRPLDLVAVLDAAERRVLRRAAARAAGALERARLGGCAAGVVAQQVERDRVQPRLLRPALAVVLGPAAQRTFERVGQQVLGQRAVAGAVGEEREQARSLGVVEPLEVLVAHPSQEFDQESGGLLVSGVDEPFRRPPHGR